MKNLSFLVIYSGKINFFPLEFLHIWILDKNSININLNMKKFRLTPQDIPNIFPFKWKIYPKIALIFCPTNISEISWHFTPVTNSNAIYRLILCILIPRVSVWRQIERFLLLWSKRERYQRWTASILWDIGNMHNLFNNNVGGEEGRKKKQSNCLEKYRNIEENRNDHIKRNRESQLCVSGFWNVE